MSWRVSFCPVTGVVADFHQPPLHDVFMTEINFLNEIFMLETLVRQFVYTSLQAAGVMLAFDSPLLGLNNSDLSHTVMEKFYLWKIKLINELIN